jgi:hypothetical protein
VNCSCATADPAGKAAGPRLVRMNAPLTSAGLLDHDHLMNPSTEVTSSALRSVYRNHLRMAATSETSYRSAQLPNTSKSGLSCGDTCFLKSSKGISSEEANSLASRSTWIFVRPSTSASLEWIPFGYFFLWRR